jgi:hypothetical protein
MGEIIIFENYEKFFKRVGKFSFVPLLPPEELYKQIDILLHHIIKKCHCSENTLYSYEKHWDNYTIFEFILYFIKNDHFLEYFTKFPKEAIKIYKHSSKYKIDMIKMLIFLIEDYELENDNIKNNDENHENDEDELEKERIKNGEKMILEAIKHAYEVWKFPLTFIALVKSFNFKLYDIAKYILTNEPELVNGSYEGETLLQIFTSDYGGIRSHILEYHK